jgi:hypothetical protein
MNILFPEERSFTPTTEKASLAMRAATFEPINSATPVTTMCLVTQRM